MLSQAEKPLNLRLHRVIAMLVPQPAPAHRPLLVSKSFTRLDSPSPEIRSATRGKQHLQNGELHLLASTPR